MRSPGHTGRQRNQRARIPRSIACSKLTNAYTKQHKHGTYDVYSSGAQAPLLPTLGAGEAEADEAGRAEPEVHGDSLLLDCLMDLGATNRGPGPLRPAVPQGNAGRAVPAPAPGPAAKER